jgi:O-succinylbenzoate synthase
LTRLYQFDFRPYQRPFKHPLSTSHGKWDVREGIILRLTDETGQVGWGEIAPISWFGSETLEQAWDFCQQLPSEISTETIFSIPAELPACQFGFESALEWGIGNSSPLPLSPSLPLPSSPKSQLADSYLLPAGEAALDSWQTPWNQGSRTFKWKIGVTQIEDELKVFDQLVQALPASTQLRLDANGGLSRQEAHQWLQASDEAGIVEFLEQPLTPKQFDDMLEMSTQYSTPIALDESVATLDQLEVCYQRGWRGIFVIKAAIAGSPKRLRQFCQKHDIDMVLSSVFETAIARQAALQLAAELSHRNRAVGFGVNHWFNEDDENWLEHLWNSH